MSTPQREPDSNAPPDFLAAKTRRQKARSAGLDPNYWYAVAQSADLKKQKVLETGFQGRSIAVFRGDDGAVRALENRCAHRHLKLSGGQVEGCRLTCPYHGWAYDQTGLASIPHETFGHDPQFRVPVVPVKEKYGLIFIFPGDPALSETRQIPVIPELDAERPWPHVVVSLDCASHYSMIIENVGDLTHGYLHRARQPFGAAKLLELTRTPDALRAEYDVKIGAGKLEDMFMYRGEAACNRIRYHYDYPYHWSNTDDHVKHCLFTLPIDATHNRHTFLFYFSPNIVRLPGIPLRLPTVVVQTMLNIARRFTMVPVLSQDVWVIEQEQRAWEENWKRPEPEVSPLIIAVQDLLISRWEAHLRSTGVLGPGPAVAAPAEERLYTAAAVA